MQAKRNVRPVRGMAYVIVRVPGPLGGPPSSGTVAAVGPGVDGLAPGDTVALPPSGPSARLDVGGSEMWIVDASEIGLAVS